MNHLLRGKRANRRLALPERALPRVAAGSAIAARSAECSGPAAAASAATGVVADRRAAIAAIAALAAEDAVAAAAAVAAARIVPGRRAAAATGPAGAIEDTIAAASA